MKRKLNYFLGDTYSKDIYPFIYDLLSPDFDLDLFNGQQDEIVIVSPCVNQYEIVALENKRILLILDFCHFDFMSLEKYIDQLKPEFIISPYKLPSVKAIQVSINLLKTQDQVKTKATNSSDIIFCSQPLREDRRGIDQYLLLETLLETTNRRIFVKKHPRESTLQAPNGVTEYNKTIEEAFAEFKNWVGFNSMALYSARFLNHNVFMIKEDYPNYQKKLTQFDTKLKSNFSIMKDLQCKTELLEKLHQELL